jgi:hypothetical protein
MLALALTPAVIGLGSGAAANAETVYTARLAAPVNCVNDGTGGQGPGSANGGWFDILVEGPDGPAEETITTTLTDGTVKVGSQTIELVDGLFTQQVISQPDGTLTLAVKGVQLIEVAIDCMTTVDPNDLDGDGVTNRKDRCPGTPAGTEVKNNGCPRPAHGKPRA